MFAALLLSAGALSDRIGPRQSFGAGLAVFVAASAACVLVDVGPRCAKPDASGCGASRVAREKWTGADPGSPMERRATHRLPHAGSPGWPQRSVPRRGRQRS